MSVVDTSPTTDPSPEADDTPIVLSKDDLTEIKSAVVSVGGMLQSLQPEDRHELKQELGQELAIKMLRGKLGPAGLRTAAKNWVLTTLRGRSNKRTVETEYAIGARVRYKVGPHWCPNWYAPHPDAQRYAPLAMREARVMFVKDGSTRSGNYVEDALIEFIDSRR